MSNDNEVNASILDYFVQTMAPSPSGESMNPVEQYVPPNNVPPLVHEVVNEDGEDDGDRVRNMPVPTGEVLKFSCLSTGRNQLASLAWYENDKKVLRLIITTNENSVSADLSFMVNYTDNGLQVPTIETMKLVVQCLPTAGNILTSGLSAVQIQEAICALNSAPQSINYAYTELYRTAPGHLTQTYQPLSVGTSVLPSVGPPTTATPALEMTLLATVQPTRLAPRGRIVPALPSIINAHPDLDYQNNNVINDALMLNIDASKRHGERRTPDMMLDMPGKGQCYVYCARFSRDPFDCSPNENFEEELPVTARGSILVWGNRDENGFFDGDGRRGLVPSNYVQQPCGRELEKFYQSMVVRLRECDDSATTTVPQNMEDMLPDEQMKRLAQQEYNNMFDDYQEDDNVDDDVIGVAIGDFGADVLVKQAESMSKDIYKNYRIANGHHHVNGGDQESQLENGCLKKHNGAEVKKSPLKIKSASMPPTEAPFLQAYHLYLRHIPYFAERAIVCPPYHDPANFPGVSVRMGIARPRLATGVTTMPVDCGKPDAEGQAEEDIVCPPCNDPADLQPSDNAHGDYHRPTTEILASVAEPEGAFIGPRARQPIWRRAVRAVGRKLRRLGRCIRSCCLCCLIRTHGDEATS